MLLVLCVTACSTSRKATEVSSSVLTTDYTNLTDKHDSVTVIIRDTLREVTTITIRENEQGDTLRVSTVTDRERLTTRDLVRATEVKIVERIDTVYIQKDSFNVEDKKIGLSASTDEKESWSTKTARLLKWTCAVIVALGALIIIIRVCYHR